MNILGIPNMNNYNQPIYSNNQMNSSWNKMNNSQQMNNYMNQNIN